MAGNSKIKNIARLSQCCDYTGLEWGKMSPTNIDGLLEIDDTLYIFIELKVRGSTMPNGQRWCLEHLADCLMAARRTAIVILAHHDTPAHIPIKVADCQVSKYYFEGKWKDVRKPYTVKEYCDKLIQSLLPGKWNQWRSHER